MKMAFDVALDALCRAPHMHGERRHRHRGDKCQQTFPERLVRSALEQDGRTDAQRHGDSDAEPDGADEFVSTALAQVRQADGNDEKGLEPFAEETRERAHPDSAGRDQMYSHRSSTSITASWTRGRTSRMRSLSRLG